GGGIANQGTLTVSNSTLSGNSTNGGGGGIINGGTLTVSNSTFSGNSAGFGGGIFSYAGTVTVSDSTLADNSSNSNGGGIANQGSTLTVSNTTLSGNSATNNGGGIENSGTMTVTNSTIADNSAAAGGGISNGGVFGLSGGLVTLNNTIVANNTSGGDLYLDGGTFSGSNDLIGDGSDLSSFSNSLSGNPLLAPLGNYGGPLVGASGAQEALQTMALLPGSPAIDAGSNALIATDPATGMLYATDQRGDPRVSGSSVDIGAFESQGFTITASSGRVQSTDANTNFANALTVTVTPNNSLEPVDGGVVTFSAPSTGASANLSATIAVISNGSASVTATANSSAGSYTVTATASGVSAPATFSLTNNAGPSNFVVTDAGDYSQQGAGDNPTDTNGGVSLRSAIAAANADAANGISDTITFSPTLDGQTLTLTQGQLELTADSGNISIYGGNQITVSGNNQSGVFTIDAGAQVNISGLTIEDGNASAGGGIYNSGTLTVSNSTLEHNQAFGEYGGEGGGIYNAGTLMVNNSTLADNSSGSGGG
ncbi:MAG: choice-of-anchor Q domain-containing protein, partial [Gemmataceae bacterium]